MSDTHLQPDALHSVHASDGGQHLGKTQARQAVTLGSVRYVLGVSLALALVAFVVLYFMFM